MRRKNDPTQLTDPVAELGLAGLDLNLLTVFDTVMVERHVTRAAQRLQLTQSAVSQSLRRLRDLFGDQLFAKDAQGVVPTARALELWPAVHVGLQSLEQALRPAAFDPRRSNKTFCIALADVLANLFLPKLYARFTDLAPNISIRLLPYDQYQTDQRLVRCETDFEVGPYPPKLAALEAQLLFQDTFVVVSRKGHPALHGPLDLDTLCALPHVVVNMTGQREYTTQFDTALANVGRARQIRLTVNHFSPAASILMATDMVAVMPKHVVLQPAYRELLQTHALPVVMPECRTYLSWHSRGNSLGAHEWFKSQLLEIFRAYAAELAG